ncbi:acyl-CoA/acyl-ACP dehydrogenase [Alphaproteobacteria bacterium KMM 3653]|uniref:Acyl-CoA/acyl-ACP dehydrogenase n=1 Tax=Harenicola maris TaxID=2841044 RepID=A0AAP2G9G6_9RHOB|nr:acyl-CoA/acyl-ACP dehydrogenase [Harenicola maris]
MSQSFLDQVAHYARGRVAPEATAWSIGAAPEPALYQEAASLGLLGMEVPEAQGGRGFGFATRAAALEVLAGADFGFAMSLVNTHNIALRLCAPGLEGAAERYLPALLSGRMQACTALTEPGTGSDFAAIGTTARRGAEGWVLNGEKAWIINGRHAGLAVVYAQCAELGDSSGIGAFLVDLTAPGVTRYAIDSAFAQTSLGTGGFHLSGVTLPDEAMVAAPGTAFKAILQEINAARTYVAAMCDGMVQAALDSAAAYGAERCSFGKPLNAIARWQAELEAAQAALAQARAATRQAVEQVAEGADAQLAAAEAKIGSVTCAQTHLPRLLQLMGAEGLRPEHPFTRHIAAAQIAGFTDGATNILKDRVARLTARKET